MFHLEVYRSAQTSMSDAFRNIVKVTNLSCRVVFEKKKHLRGNAQCIRVQYFLLTNQFARKVLKHLLSKFDLPFFIMQMRCSCCTLEFKRVHSSYANLSMPLEYGTPWPCPWTTIDVQFTRWFCINVNMSMIEGIADEECCLCHG